MNIVIYDGSRENSIISYRIIFANISDPGKRDKPQWREDMFSRKYPKK